MKRLPRQLKKAAEMRDSIEPASLWLGAARLVLITLILVLGSPTHTAWARGAAISDSAPVSGTPQPPPTLPGEPQALPDLQTLPPFNLVLIDIPSTGRRLLRFSNSIANTGLVDLKLAGQYAHDVEGYKVSQNLPVGEGAFAFVELDEGHIRYHDEHYHWHLDDFARYEVWTAAPGGVLRDLVRTNGKVSYCIMDTDRLPGTQDTSGYHTCGPSLQGLSVGWADTYERHLPGQWVDIGGLADGLYALRSIVDPGDFLQEINDDNNDVLVTFYLQGGSLQNIQTAAADWTHTRARPNADLK